MLPHLSDIAYFNFAQTYTHASNPTLKWKLLKLEHLHKPLDREIPKYRPVDEVLFKKPHNAFRKQIFIVQYRLSDGLSLNWDEFNGILGRSL